MEHVTLMERELKEEGTESSLKSARRYIWRGLSPLEDDTKNILFGGEEESQNWFLEAEPSIGGSITVDWPAFKVQAPAAQTEWESDIVFANVPIGVSLPAGCCIVATNFVASWQGLFVQPSSGLPISAVDSQRLPPVLEQRLEQFKQLPEGWDSYGSRPISPKAIDMTESILAKAISDRELGLPLPFMVPTSKGGVGLEWKLESGKELLLEISPEGDVSYLLVEPRPDGGEKETEVTLRNPEELEKVFNTLS